MIKYNNSNINDWYYYESNLIKVYRNNAVVYQKIGSNDYLRFISKGSGTFTFFDNGSDTANTLSYSLDSGRTWTSLSNGSSTPSVSSGDVVMWKGENLSIVSGKGIGTFSSTTEFDAEGNIMSLLYGDNFINRKSLSGKNYAFMNLFSGCTTINSAENLELPATTLSQNCYTNMFNRATNLTAPPPLPATTLANGCYFNMFYCTPTSSSMVVNESYLLPATTLVQDCYRQMFYGRSGFDKITCLATSGINENNSTTDWLRNAASTGTFTKDSNTTWPTGNSGTSTWTVVDYIE